MRILIANGCSNTAGTDIDPNNLIKSPENAWPRWVADELGMSYVNLATVGSGNEQIYRSTAIAISNIVDKDKVDPKSLVVAICWSGFDRYEYWNGTDHRSFSLSSTHVVKQPDPLVKKYIEYRSLMEPEDYSYYKNLFYVYMLAKFLESYGIEYHFSNCLQTFEHPDYFEGSDAVKKEYYNLLDLYGEERMIRHMGFFDDFLVFQNYLQDVPRSPYGNKHHWGVEGQKKYAKLFVENMK